MKLFGRKRNKKDKTQTAEERDDYDWSQYHTDYSNQLSEIEKIHKLRLDKNDYVFDGHLTKKENSLPLHPNHHCLYETIGILDPTSVIEIGCGGGDHLQNLGLLFPQIALRGFDRSEQQLATLRQRNPQVADKVAALDITLPPSRTWPVADAVYTQAVLMHLQIGNSHLVALSNVFRMSTRFVVLMENFHRHNFVQDINYLWANSMIDWKTLKLYFRRFEGNPHILIASNEELDLEPLVDYGILF